MKLCSKCKTKKPFESFSPQKSGKFKLSSWCIQCKREKQQERRRQGGIAAKPIPIIIDDNHKECLMCKEILHIENFRPNKRGRLGRGAYCLLCEKKYSQSYHLKPGRREKTKLSTRKYRDNHREHWRTLHRINMFQRRHKIAAQSDNTVTEEFMIKLYQKEYCCWCEKFTPMEERTAEHIIPLTKGGKHSIFNLDMACITCNSSKLNF